MPIEFDADQDFYVDLEEYAGGRGDATRSEADPVEIVSTLEGRITKLRSELALTKQALSTAEAERDELRRVNRALRRRSFAS